MFLAATVVWGIATRDPLSLDVIRDRNAFYRETLDGMIEKVYTLKIINKGGAQPVFGFN